MNVEHVLSKHKIGTNSVVRLCSEVGQYIRNSNVPELTATQLVSELVGKPVRFQDPIYAGIFVKALAGELHSVGYVMDDADAFIESATDYTKNFCNDPKWSFLWAQPDSDDKPRVDESVKVQVSTEIDVKVAVRADGSIKKGGKSVLADELFRTKVLEASEPLTSQQFIQLLVSEVKLTPAGASTYRYNLWKKHGMLKPKQLS